MPPHTLHIVSVLMFMTLPLWAQEHKPCSDLPADLSHGDWSSIRAAYDAGRHAAVPDGDGYRARNPEQSFRTHFDAKGFTIVPDSGEWTFGLELLRWGFAREASEVTQTQDTRVEGNRVTYDWSENLSEWWINDTRGVEHGYTVHRRPMLVGKPSGQRLMFTLAVRGSLRPTVTEDGLSAHLLNSEGATILHYSGLIVYDADRKVLPARMDILDGQLQISVDEQHARYPLTVDPIAQQAYLKASNTNTGDEFGRAVAVAGDTVVVGARSEDSNATGVNGNQSDNSSGNSGAAYVFVRSGATWTQQAYLKASNTASIDLFGSAVAISGDTIVVGASGEDSNATGVNGDETDNSAIGSGAAYVFVRSGTNWTQQAYLKASNTDSGDKFGTSVSVSGDTIVIGAPSESSLATGVNGAESDNSAPNAGAAYVFIRSGTSWSQQAYLKASNSDAQDQFGESLSVSGDTVVVGAWAEDSDATGVDGNQISNATTNAGAAYVYVRSGANWSQEAYLKASNTEAVDWFGRSVSISADTILVGAPREDSDASGVNGDQTNNFRPQSGAAYVFVRSATTWTQEAYIKASNTDSNDAFGISVSVFGEFIVVGAEAEASGSTGVNGTQNNNGTSLSGAAYVFVRSGTIWSQQAYLKASNTNALDWFGFSTAVSGDTVIVGAWGESSNATGVNGDQTANNATNAGAAYAFLLPLGTATVLGTGCPTVPFAPTLAVSTSILGETAVLSISNATPSAQGWLYSGTLYPTPALVAPACNLYLDFSSLQLLFVLTTDSLGAWSTMVPIPQDPALAGQQISLQAAVFSISSPIGLELTNALDVVFGY